MWLPLNHYFWWLEPKVSTYKFRTMRSTKILLPQTSSSGIYFVVQSKSITMSSEDARVSFMRTSIFCSPPWDESCHLIARRLCHRFLIPDPNTYQSSIMALNRPRCTKSRTDTKTLQTPHLPPPLLHAHWCRGNLSDQNIAGVCSSFHEQVFSWVSSELDRLERESKDVRIFVIESFGWFNFVIAVFSMATVMTGHVAHSQYFCRSFGQSRNQNLSSTCLSQQLQVEVLETHTHKSRHGERMIH
jgi:hypothetical protein